MSHTRRGDRDCVHELEGVYPSREYSEQVPNQPISLADSGSEGGGAYHLHLQLGNWGGEEVGGRLEVDEEGEGGRVLRRDVKGGKEK